VKLLLDTGVWLRAVSEPATIPSPILQRLENSAEPFGLAAISLWEVGKKVQIGKLQISGSLADWLGRAVATNIALLPLTADVVADAMSLPDFPNHDPADEIIVATARVHGLTLMTTDRALRRYRHASVQYFTPRAVR
jgi:PIN domain nuclease of toxin-antitoxin system